MTRTLLALISALTILAATGCVRTYRRAAGEDCSVVNAVFREANGGVGPEFVRFYGDSYYGACAAPGHVPGPVVQTFTAEVHRRFPTPSSIATYNGDATPIAGSVKQTWTEPYDGVLYRYTSYELVFNGCDFWYSSNGLVRCAAAGVTPAS